VEQEQREQTDTAEPALARRISRPVLLFLVLGIVLGTGIYTLVGSVAARVGGLTWAAFVLALALAGISVPAYAELVTKYPRAAGAALYVRLAFDRPLLTFLVGACVLTSVVAGAATAARAFAGSYLAALVDVPVLPVVISFVLLAGVVALRGITESTRTAVVLTVVELLGLLLVVAVGVAAVLAGTGDLSRATVLPAGASPLPALIGAAGLAVFLFTGFDEANQFVEETRNPTRALPLALYGGLTVAAVVYVLVSLAAVTVVPATELSTTNAALVTVVERGPLPLPSELFTVFGLVAVSNNGLLSLVVASRLLYGLGQQRTIPALFGRVGRRASPTIAVLTTVALTVILAMSGAVEQLASTTVVALLAVFVVVNICCLRLRRDRVDHDHYRAPTLLPVLGIGVSLALFTTQSVRSFLLAGLLMTVFIALYLLAQLGARRHPARNRM